VSAGFVWLAATAGALSLVTPCVFPMVPITVSYFTQHGAESRAAAIRHAILFGLGIVASFTALGLAMAALNGASAVLLLAANPWVNIALAVVFVAFALNLLGVLHVAVPTMWVGALDRWTRRQEHAGRLARVSGAALTGATFTLTSFTCTAPFVGTVLVTAAQGSWRMPLVGMLVYATVFALPFCVLALVPHWVGRLPRAGSWMVAIKVVMAFVELAAALKFLANADLVWRWGVFTRSVVLSCWVVLAVLTTGYLALRLPRPANEALALTRAPGRLLSAAGAFAVACWLATGLAGRSLGELESFLPPATSQLSGAGQSAQAPLVLNWRLNDLPAALAEARQGDKRVFVDFTGYTCTNCRWMEANMFPRPEVRAALSQFVLSRLFTDGDGPLYERQQDFQLQHFQTVALPLYAILDANGRTVATLPGLTRDPVVFVAFLQRGLVSTPR
jgi:thiol:disulfide interchange protein DsbD